MYCKFNIFIKLSSFFIKIILLEMQTPEPENEFHEETDTFNLTATLKGDKLTIALKDFTDWAIYENQYTKDDIGK